MKKLFIKTITLTGLFLGSQDSFSAAEKPPYFQHLASMTQDEIIVTIHHLRSANISPYAIAKRASPTYFLLHQNIAREAETHLAMLPHGPRQIVTAYLYSETSFSPVTTGVRKDQGLTHLGELILHQPNGKAALEKGWVENRGTNTLFMTPGKTLFPENSENIGPYTRVAIHYDQSSGKPPRYCLINPYRNDSEE